MHPRIISSLIGAPQVPKPPVAYNTGASTGWGYTPPTAAAVTQAIELSGKGPDDQYDFDQLPIEYQRGAIVDMLNKIPKVRIAISRLITDV